MHLHKKFVFYVRSLTPTKHQKRLRTVHLYSTKSYLQMFLSTWTNRWRKRTKQPTGPQEQVRSDSGQEKLHYRKNPGADPDWRGPSSAYVSKNKVCRYFRGHGVLRVLGRCWNDAPLRLVGTCSLTLTGAFYCNDADALLTFCFRFGVKWGWPPKKILRRIDM